MTPLEKQLLVIFLKDIGFLEYDIYETVDKTVIVERKPDPVGFHTTLKIPNMEKIDNKIHWGRAEGESSQGVSIGFAIYKYEDYLILEGYTYGAELYPHDDKNIKLWLDE